MRRARLDALTVGAAALRHAAVSRGTLCHYKAAVLMFDNFSRVRRWDLSPDGVCDSMEKFFWFHAERGFSVALGRHTLYGWLHLRCPSKSVTAHQLDNARDALAGWCKLHGDDSRDPLPEEITLALVRTLLSSRQVLTAAAVFLQPQFYLRPSEMIAVRAADVILPLAGVARYHAVGIVVAPRELEVTTKSRTHDDTILVDGACHPDSTAVLHELARVRSDGDRLFPALTLSKYEESFRVAGAKLGLAHLNIVPHMMRHTGPSNDLFHGRRNIQEVAKRGRWKNLKSVHRYAKSGRLLGIWKKVRPQDRTAWMRAAPGTGAILLAALRLLPVGFGGS